MATKQIRHSRHITKKEDVEYFLKLKEKDITTSFIMETFGEFDNKSRFNPYDTIDIPPNSYHGNKNTFTTTLGLWIFNIYFIDQDLFHVFGYIQKPVNKKLFGVMNSQMTYALMEDRITLEQHKKYLMKGQKFMPYVSVLSPSQTMMMLTCTKFIEKKKKELYNKYKDEIEKGNEIIAEQMEKELLDYARELLKDDPSMDSFDSGARGSFGNNFKNMYVMKAAVRNPDPDAEKKYDIVMSNFMQGISREDYAVMAKSLAAGPMKRGVKTAIGGYMEKQLLNAFQHVVVDEAGTDCKTKRYLEVDFSKHNIKDYIYSYIIQGENLIEITSENMSKYDGKKVKIRFSSLCEHKNGICHKCAGNLFNRLINKPGKKNIGMAIPILGSTLKNLSMKSFHDSSIITTEMEPLKAFL